MSTPENTAAAAPKKEKAVKAPKIEQNGISRPGAGTATGKVWEIADSISQATGKPASRKSVLEDAQAAGINPATAATQYGRWRKFHGLEGRGDEDTGTAASTEAPAVAPAAEAGAVAEAPAAQ